MAGVGSDFEDWEVFEGPQDEQESPSVAPFLFIIIASVLLLGLFFFPPPPQWEGFQALGYIVGVATVSAGTAWLIGFAVILRKSATGWKIAAFAVLLGVALIAAGSAWVGARLALAADMAWADRLRLDARGNLIRPRGNPPGPISRRVVQTGERLKALRVEFETSVNDGAINHLGDVFYLKRYPALTRDCSWVDGKDADIAGYFSKSRAELRSLRKDFAPLPIPPSERENLVKTLEKGMRLPLLDELEQAMHRRMALVRTQCDILHRGHWEQQGRMIVFTSMRDLNDYRDLIGRIDKDNAELKAVLEKVEAQMRRRAN